MFNTEQRNKAKKNKDEIGIVGFKLMNNAVYGKTLENELGYSQTNIINDPEKLPKYTSLPTFKNGVLLNNDMFTIQYIKEKPFVGSGFAPDQYLKVSINNTDKVWYFNHPEPP